MIENIEIELVERNLKFKRKFMQKLENIEIEEHFPKFPILFLTCMDPRINVFEIFQFNRGDVFVLRNAGNLYSLDVLRSIIFAIVKFNIKYIVVLGHLDCGMTKINLNEFREKLPIKFLSSLTQKYSEHIPKIKNFFKPFLDEIQNIKEQIKSLELIKDFYPGTQIIGMLYDFNTGLVFENGILEDYDDIENFKNNYKEILIHKRNQFTEFIAEIKTKDISIKNLNELKQTGELNEEVSSSIPEINEEINKIPKDKNGEIKEKRKNYSSAIIPKISIPKVQFHGVKIYIPRISREKRKILINSENK